MSICKPCRTIINWITWGTRFGFAITTIKATSSGVTFLKLQCKQTAEKVNITIAGCQCTHRMTCSISSSLRTVSRWITWRTRLFSNGRSGWLLTGIAVSLLSICCIIIVSWSWSWAGCGWPWRRSLGWSWRWCRSVN